MLLGLLLGVAFVAFGISLVTTGDGLLIVFGVILGLLGLVCTIVCALVCWSHLQIVIGTAEPALVVDDAGIGWHLGVRIPWEQVTGLTIETESSISMAGGSHARTERAIEASMAKAGVGDGERSIIVHVRDRASLAQAAGKAGYLVHEGAAAGSGRVRMLLSAITDSATFSSAARALQDEAERRGIPFEVVARA